MKIIKLFKIYLFITISRVENVHLSEANWLPNKLTNHNSLGSIVIAERIQNVCWFLCGIYHLSVAEQVYSGCRDAENVA